MLQDSKSVGAQVGRFVGSPTKITLSDTTAVRSGQLKPRTPYRIYFSATGTFKWGNSSVTATDNDHPSTAGIADVHATDDTNVYISCKVPTGTGVVYVSELALD